MAWYITNAEKKNVTETETWTKDGKDERKIFEALGFEKDYTGKAYQYWNPGKHNCQNVDTKEAGARAGADVLKKYGFKAYAASRLD